MTFIMILAFFILTVLNVIFWNVAYDWYKTGKLKDKHNLRAVAFTLTVLALFQGGVTNWLFLS